MAKFLIGVEVERSETTEILVEVEAETLQDARVAAAARARKLDSDDVREVCRDLEWDTDGYLTIGTWTDVEYKSPYYEPDFPVEDQS